MIVSQNSNMQSTENFISNAKFLTESESEIYPEMVMVVDHGDKKVIRTEDLLEFATNQGIDNGSEALSMVCEANGVDIDDVVLSMDESNILYDIELADTLRHFKESGFDVTISPLSHKSPAYIIAESILSSDLKQDEINYLVEAFMEDDYSTLVSNEYICEQLETKYNKNKQWLRETFKNSESIGLCKWQACKEAALNQF